MRNYRFWQYENGSWVKLTLHPGQVLAWSTGGRTDEGWSAEGFVLHFHHTGVIDLDRWSDGVDCDGRMSRNTSFLVDVSTPLAPYKDDGTVYMRPDWHQDRASQRDYRAEAAGY